MQQNAGVGLNIQISIRNCKCIVDTSAVHNIYLPTLVSSKMIVGCCITAKETIKDY